MLEYKRHLLYNIYFIWILLKYVFTRGFALPILIKTSSHYYTIIIRNITDIDKLPY